MTTTRHPAFYVSREAWWHDENTSDNTVFMIGDYSLDGAGGCTWEFSIAEYQFRDAERSWLRVKVFADGFQAFTEIPEFFTGLAALGEFATPQQVRDLMMTLGWADVTQRTPPAVRA